MDAKGLAKGALIFGAIWLAAVVASGAGFNPLGINWNFENPGSFGDAFGPLSALMAGVAAVGAIAALHSQRDELRRLKDRQAGEDARADRQDFERTFFQLLAHHRAIVSEIDVEGTVRRTGQDAFRAIVAYLDARKTVGLMNAWEETYKFYRNDLGHYFRFLFHFVSFVDEKKGIDNYRYVRWIRASLSESEILLLALNCVWGEGREKFKDLVEKYALLHNLSDQAAVQYQLKGLYDVSAFRSSERARSSDGVPSGENDLRTD